MLIGTQSKNRINGPTTGILKFPSIEVYTIFLGVVSTPNHVQSIGCTWLQVSTNPLFFLLNFCIFPFPSCFNPNTNVFIIVKIGITMPKYIIKLSALRKKLVGSNFFISATFLAANFPAASFTFPATSFTLSAASFTLMNSFLETSTNFGSASDISGVTLIVSSVLCRCSGLETGAFKSSFFSNVGSDSVAFILSAITTILLEIVNRIVKHKFCLFYRF